MEAALRRTHAMLSCMRIYWVWRAELSPSSPAKGPDFSQGEFSQAGHDTAEFSETANHFRKIWLWDLS